MEEIFDVIKEMVFDGFLVMTVSLSKSARSSWTAADPNG